MDGRVRHRGSGDGGATAVRLEAHEPQPRRVRARRERQPRLREQRREVDRLAALDVLREERVGECTIAGHGGQRVTQIGHRVGASHESRGLALRLAEPLPQGTHVVVQRHASVGALPKRQVEADADRRAVRVVRHVRVLPVRAVDVRGGIDQRREPTHLDSRPQPDARARECLAGEGAERTEHLAILRKSSTPEDEFAVVRGEALCEPQLSRHVRLREVERLERRRADAFDVPCVEELVRDRAEVASNAALQAHVQRAYGAVAVFHAVASRPRQVVHQERVAARIEGGQLAEDGTLLGDDALDVLREGLDLGVGAEVMDDDANRGGGFVAGWRDRELAQRRGAELDGGIEQVLQVRCGEDVCVGRREELRERAPRGAGRRHETHANVMVGERGRPEEDRRGVDVRVGVVDGEVGAVDVVAEEAVADGDRVSGRHDTPDVGSEGLQCELCAVGRSGREGEEVLGELVGRVAAWRRPAHAHLERLARLRGEARLDLHPAFLRGGEAEGVVDGLSEGAVGEGRDEDEGEGNAEPVVDGHI